MGWVGLIDLDVGCLRVVGAKHHPRHPNHPTHPGAEGDFDALFVGWPQIVDLSHVTPATPLGMYYHTFNAQTFGFEIGLATSRNGGRSWEKQGPCKMTRGAPGSHRWVGGWVGGRGQQERGLCEYVGTFPP